MHRYWAFTTLTTVGYGDISAHTELERFFAMVMLILGAGLFATIVGKISALASITNDEQQVTSNQAHTPMIVCSLL